MAKGQEEAANLIEWFAEDASRDTSEVFQFVIHPATWRRCLQFLVLLDHFIQHPTSYDENENESERKAGVTTRLLLGFL